jgi:hypothetical protein
MDSMVFAIAAFVSAALVVTAYLFRPARAVPVFIARRRR